MDNPNFPKMDGAMLVPSPRDVDAVIRSVPEGSVVTIAKLREVLAGKHGADRTCPLTSGIFVRIAAEAAEESAREG